MYLDITDEEFVVRLICFYVVKALCDMGSSLDSTIGVMDEMERNNIKLDVVTFNMLLNAFYRTKRIEDGDKLWDLMEKKNAMADVWNYNSRLLGLVLNDRILDAVELIEEMIRKGGNIWHVIPFACDKDDFGYAFELCKKAMKTKQMVYNNIVQRLIDGLLWMSKNKEAKELLKLAKFD
ncbi:hypothetical protein ACH5RR_017729 [Cinchona calisaya]|uniref:Pentatricopeptide repeat-containing protein n=1 Tax=Cinchona calisaya TaxID=153742 RepID=A0ABD2ZMN2_9GENT